MPLIPSREAPPPLTETNLPDQSGKARVTAIIRCFLKLKFAIGLYRDRIEYGRRRPTRRDSVRT